jgi:hypothetical protein
LVMSLPTPVRWPRLKKRASDREIFLLLMSVVIGEKSPVQGIRGRRPTSTLRRVSLYGSNSGCPISRKDHDFARCLFRRPRGAST